MNKTFYNSLSEKAKKRHPVIGCGVGCGLTARACETGDADFMAVYHTAIYRILGLPTILSFLPYDDCNQLVFDALPSIQANVKKTPLFAGLGAHDPRHSVESLVDRAMDFNISGIVNEPFCGSYGSMIREGLNACGLGFSREHQMLKYAVSQNLSALGWAYSKEEAQILSASGIPFIGLIMDNISVPEATSFQDSALIEYIDAIQTSIKSENPDCLLLLHGKYLSSLPSISYLLSHSLCDGYFTGSTGESIPAVEGICNSLKTMQQLSLK